MCCRHNVPANKGGLEEPKILDELVHLVGECIHCSLPKTPPAIAHSRE